MRSRMTLANIFATAKTGALHQDHNDLPLSFDSSGKIQISSESSNSVETAARRPSQARGKRKEKGRVRYAGEDEQDMQKEMSKIYRIK